jgi:hypothetical protein
MDTMENTSDINEEAIMPSNIPNVAYIRPVKNGGAILYAVCVEGKELALFDSEEAAYYTARQHELEARLVH